MQGIEINFKNRPNDDGSLTNLSIKNCLISPNGTPTARKPQVLIHLPKIEDANVEGAWFDYGGGTYHVIGTTAPLIEANTPTSWNRYCIAEKIY